MGISERKNKFVEQFMKIEDERKIQQFEELLSQEDIVAYSVEGTPLNKVQYASAILSAEEGTRFISVQDLEKEVETWYYKSNLV